MDDAFVILVAEARDRSQFNKDILQIHQNILKHGNSGFNPPIVNSMLQPDVVVLPQRIFQRSLLRRPAPSVKLSRPELYTKTSAHQSHLAPAEFQKRARYSHQARLLPPTQSSPQSTLSPKTTLYPPPRSHRPL